MSVHQVIDEHNWVDDATLRDGRSWQIGVRFLCTRCGTERRKFDEGGFFIPKGGKRTNQTPTCLVAASGAGARSRC